MEKLGLLLILTLGCLWIGVAQFEDPNFPKDCQPECKRNLAMVCGTDGTTNRTFDNDCFLSETNRCHNTSFTIIAYEACSEDDYKIRLSQQQAQTTTN